MLIGSLQLELHIPEANSLKSKRYVLRSMMDRIRSKFNVSASELDGQDLWQSSLIGVAVIGNEKKHMDQVLSQVLNLIRQEKRLEVLDSKLEFL